jgi:arsenate reductase
LTTVAENTAPENVQLFHIPTCGTCRKAISALAAAGLRPTLVDLRQSPPDAALLAGLVADSGLPPRTWFNTSGQSYKAGGWAAKAGALDAAGVVAALAGDPMLIKRPVVVHESGAQRVVLVGFDAAAWSAAGLLPAVRA